jgi:hypothetical protein
MKTAGKVPISSEHPPFPTLHKLWLAIQGKFLRDLQFAIKLTCTFVVSALIAFNSNYKNQALIGWVLPVLALLLIGDTAGGSILAARLSVVNFVPMGIFIYILQKIGMGYRNYASASILFFIVSFWVGYVNPSTQSRKIALVFPVILFTTLVSTPRQYVTNTIVWDLLGECLMSCTISLAISFLILPRFACLEVHDRFNYTLHRTSEVFDLTIRGMMASHAAKAEVYLTEAESLLQNCRENHELLDQRMYFSQFEIVSLIRFLFNRHQILYNQYSTSDLASISASLLLHVHVMMHSVRAIHFNEYHADACKQADTAFFAITEALQHVIRTLDDEKHFHIWFFCQKYQNAHEIHEALNQLQTAINYAYEVLSLSLRSAQLHAEEQTHFKDVEEDNDDDLSANRMTKKLSSDYHLATSNSNTTSQFHPLPPPSLRSTFDHLFTSSRSLHHLDNNKSSNLHTKNHEENEEQDQDEEEEEDLAYDLDAPTGNRLAFSNFLFHLTEYVQILQSKFQQTIEKPTSLSSQKQDKPSSPPLPLPCHSCYTLIKLFFLNYCYFPAQTFFMQQWILYTTDIYAKLKTGLRTAILLGIGFIFVEVPILANKFEQGQWIMLAMIFSQGENLGGTIAQMRLRLLGTMMGAIYSYFIYIAVEIDSNAILAMFVPFIFINGFIRQSKTWSYFGSIAVTTALIVTYGRIAYIDPVIGNYSLLRIQQNALGILVGLMTSLLTIPTFGADYLKLNIQNVFQNMSEATNKLGNVYAQHIETHFTGGNSNINSISNENEGEDTNTIIDDNNNNNNNNNNINEKETVEKELTIIKTIMDQSCPSTPSSPHTNTNNHLIENIRHRSYSKPISLTYTDEGGYNNDNNNNNSNEEVEKEIGNNHHHEQQQQYNRLHHYLTQDENKEYIISLDELQTIHISTFSHQNSSSSTTKKAHTPPMKYIFPEYMKIRLALNQQPLFIEQATFETILSSKPFPELLYQRLLLCEEKILQYIVSLDCELTRIELFLHMETATRAISYGAQVSQEIHYLLTTIQSILLEYGPMVAKTVLIPNTPSEFVSIYGNKKGVTKQIHYHRREIHGNKMQRLHSLAMKLYTLSQELNHRMFTDWLEQVLTASGLTTTVVATTVGLTSAEPHQDSHDLHHDHDHLHHHNKLTPGAIVRHLFDMITVFNALFFSASHLSKSVIELCNIIMIITELDYRTNHRPF